MTSDDWDIIKSYRERDAKRDDWHDADIADGNATITVIYRYGIRLQYRVETRWCSEERKNVRTDNVVITQYQKDKTDMQVEASIDYAREHYRNAIRNGFKLVFFR